MKKNIKKLITDYYEKGYTANNTYETLKSQDIEIGRNAVYRLYKKLQSEHILKIEDIDKEKAKTDFWYYANIIAKMVFGFKEGFNKRVHGEWWSWHKECKNRLKLMLVPRGTYKTTFFTVILRSWRIGNNPNIRIVILNAVADNAYEMAGTIQAIIEHDVYKYIFGDIVGKKNWRKTKFTVKRDKVVKGSTVSAFGISANLASIHCDDVVYDDLHAERNTKTLTLMDAVKTAFKQSLQILDPGGTGDIIATRWNEYDTYHYMLTQMKDVFSEDENVYLRAAYNSDGSLYYPELLSEKVLEMKRKEIADDRIYSAFYLNDPRSEQVTTFHVSDFRYFNNYPKNCYTYLIIDPAFTKHRTSDETGFVILKTTSIWVKLEGGGKARHRQVYICRAWGEKLEPKELVDTIIDLYSEWKPQKVAIESYGINTVLSTYIKEVQGRRNTRFPIQDVRYPSIVTKQGRIEKLAYYYKQNRWSNAERDVRLPSTIYHYKHNNRNYCEALEDQLLKFRPSADRMKDDICDSLSYFPLVVSYPRPKIIKQTVSKSGRTIEEIERAIDRGFNQHQRLGWSNVRTRT